MNVGTYPFVSVPSVPESQSKEILENLDVFHKSCRKMVRMIAKQYDIIEIIQQPHVSFDDLIVRDGDYRIRYKSKAEELYYTWDFRKMWIY